MIHSHSLVLQCVCLLGRAILVGMRKETRSEEGPELRVRRRVR